MVAIKNPEVIEGRRWLIAMDVTEPEEIDKYGVDGYDVTTFQKEGDNGLIEVGATTCVAASET